MSKRTKRIANCKEWKQYQEAKATVKAFEDAKHKKRVQRQHNRAGSMFRTAEELKQTQRLRYLHDMQEYAELKFIVDHNTMPDLHQTTLDFFNKHLATLMESIINYKRLFYKTKSNEN